MFKNDWIVQEAPHFGSWEWTFSIDSKKLDLYLSAMHSFWIACETLGMWGLPSVYTDATDYVADAQTHFADFGVLHFASAGLLPRAANAYSRGNRLTYFDRSSKVQTAWVDDAGQLLRDLYPDLLLAQKHCMDLYPALRVWGGRIASKKTVLTFGVLLHSNIWFPELPFGLHPDPDPYAKVRVIDNSLLAFENSRGLNLWLSQVQELIRGLGGKVEFLQPQQKAYRRLVNINGIVLD